MKKKLALLLCVILTLCVFVGCKGDKPINTVDTSNTADTSGKIETETVLDDKYANSEKPFSEYTLEEFEKLDISDKYVMADVERFDSEHGIERFKEYGVKCVIYLFRWKIDRKTFDNKLLFELETSSRENLLKTINKMEQLSYCENLRPIALKEVEKVEINKDNTVVSAGNASSKPYYQYTTEEFEKLDIVENVVEAEISNEYLYNEIPLDFFSDINAEIIEIQRYEYTEDVLAKIFLKEKSKTVVLDALVKLKDNPAVINAEPYFNGLVYAD